MGGKARAAKLTSQRRTQIARLAADVRWGNVSRRRRALKKRKG